MWYGHPPTIGDSESNGYLMGNWIPMNWLMILPFYGKIGEMKNNSNPWSFTTAKKKVFKHPINSWSTASLKNTYPLHRDVRKKRLCRIRDPATPTWKYSQTPPAAGDDDDGFNGLICLGNLHENIRTRFGFENRMAKKCGVSQQKVANVLFMPFWIWTAKLFFEPKRGLLLSRWRTTVWCLFQYVSISVVLSSVSSVTSAVRTEVVRVELLSSFPPRIGEASLDGWCLNSPKNERIRW